MKLSTEYMAGIIDGEGHIRRDKSRNGQGRVFYRSSIIVCNTHKELVETLKENFGGRISTQRYPNPKHPNWNPLYRWQIDGPKAEELARSLRPYLLVKREQVASILDYTKRPFIKRKCNCRRVERRHARNCTIRNPENLA